MAQVCVGLAELPELIERVAEAEMRHRVARLETAAPDSQSLLAVGSGRHVEVGTVDRRLVAEVRLGSDDHLAGAGLVETEERAREPGAGPDRLDLRSPRVELVEVDDVKATRASRPLGDEVGEVLVERPPAGRLLAVREAPELERAEPVIAWVAADEEGGIAHW
jgi:hypothetical protein